jgi:solute:Na+ symporter, SSS family
MSPLLILISICLYFSLLLLIAWYTSRNADNNSYFNGNKASPWIAVALGMIGDSLSGVTFISLPGSVGGAQFSYMQLVLGYLLGYFIIARVLLPIYYKQNLTSIYSYLNNRFGRWSQRSGSFFFLISRLIGAALRLYLTAGVLQLFVFDSWNVPFAVTVSVVIALMLLYTYRGGIKTLVWTDTFQSILLLAGVILSIWAILSQLDWSLGEAVTRISESKYSQIFFWEWKERSFFVKQFLSGAFIAVVMTGLDQNMMQKNLSCPSLKDAQKNIYSFTAVLVLVNLFFVCLGALLYMYAEQKGISLPVDPASGKPLTDNLFPLLALQHLGSFAAVVFIVGLTAATFSSADSVLTTLTTSFCIDFLNIDGGTQRSEREKKRIRQVVHIAFAFLLLGTILIARYINKTFILDAIFSVAAYTYGPLLGMFAFGLFSKWEVKDKWVPLVCLLSPVLCFVIKENELAWFGGYKFNYELLLLNGLFTFAGLYFLKRPRLANDKNTLAL